MTSLFNFLKDQTFLRFIIGGGINTTITYGLYLLLNNFLNYQSAFFIAYFGGILLAYWFNSTFVFKVPLSWRKLFLYPTIYLFQYLLSAFLLHGVIEIIGIPKVWAPLLVITIMFPLNFLMNKFALTSSFKPFSIKS